GIWTQSLGRVLCGVRGMDRIRSLLTQKRQAGSGRSVSRNRKRGQKMAEGTVTEPTYVTQLAAALQEAVPDAQLSYEQVRRDRYRFILVAEMFENMGHPERQRLVWQIADSTLSK